MNVYLILALVLFGYMTLWFFVSLIIKRNDVADIAWGIGFVLLAWISFFIFGHGQPLALIVNALVTLWGLRLAVHIFRRNRGRKEDYRYMKWRKEWGRWFYARSYGQVYLLQGFFLFLIIQPVLFVNSLAEARFSLLAWIGVFVWFAGFFFEVIGDGQLSRFIKNPENKGKIMQSGLWRFTRHPNYFGEVTLWWGVFLAALGFPGGWRTIIGPLTITCLIVFVSGIPMLEKKYAGRPDWAAYKKSTSVFFPLPPKKN